MEPAPLSFKLDLAWLSLLTFLVFAAGFGLFLRWVMRQSESSRRVASGIVMAVALVVGLGLLNVLMRMGASVSINSAPQPPPPVAVPQQMELAAVPHLAEAET